MRYYIDTSVMVAAHCAEPETERVQNWLALHSPSDIVTSTWLLTETESALSIKERRGEITRLQHRQISGDIAVFSSRIGFIEVPIEADFLAAQKLCEVASSRLRAGDGLHLAIALRLKAKCMITLDEVLANNAIANGMLSGLLPRS
jgi:uncharacterized protein